MVRRLTIFLKVKLLKTTDVSTRTYSGLGIKRRFQTVSIKVPQLITT